MPSLLDAHFHFGIERPISTFGANLDLDHALPSGGIVNGTHPADWANILELSSRHPQFIPALGIHPRTVEQCPQDWQKRLQIIPGTGQLYNRRDWPRCLPKVSYIAAPANRNIFCAMAASTESATDCHHSLRPSPRSTLKGDHIHARPTPIFNACLQRAN